MRYSSCAARKNEGRECKKARVCDDRQDRERERDRVRASPSTETAKMNALCFGKMGRKLCSDKKRRLWTIWGSGRCDGVSRQCLIRRIDRLAGLSENRYGSKGTRSVPARNPWKVDVVDVEEKLKRTHGKYVAGRGE